MFRGPELSQNGTFAAKRKSNSGMNSTGISLISLKFSRYSTSLRRKQRRAALRTSRRARVVDDGPTARNALIRRRRDAVLDPADETLERVVHVRLQKFELGEVAAALAVALDVVAVLHFVEPVLGSFTRGDDGVAERPRVPVDRQERVHRALDGNQRLADVAVRRDSPHALREVKRPETRRIVVLL